VGNKDGLVKHITNSKLTNGKGGDLIATAVTWNALSRAIFK
jgi:hypothetical protein